jgi:predicted O-methyltransferase YrrM
VKNIHAIYGDAKRVLPTLRENYFDLVYIDAMKREYLDYLILALPLMTLDALIVIDDVEKYAKKMENLYVYLSENQIKYTLEKTDTDDSIMIIERKNV